MTAKFQKTSISLTATMERVRANP